MTLRSLSALLSMGLLSVTMSACFDSDKDDDTGEGDEDTDSDTDVDDDDDDGDTDTDTDDDDGFEVDALYFQYEVTLRDYSLVPYIYDDAENLGFVYFWFVNADDWEGTDDTDNGCIVAYEISEAAGAIEDVDLSSDGLWGGWEISTLIPAAETDITGLLGWSESCDEIANLDLHPSEVVDSHTWGFGLGPLSADLDSALAGVYGDDWATYGPSAFGGYLNIDAGTEDGGVAELSYGLAFAIEEDNTLVVNDDNTLEFIEVGDDGAGGTGYFRAFPAYGLDPAAL